MRRASGSPARTPLRRWGRADGPARGVQKLLAARDREHLRQEPRAFHRCVQDGLAVAWGVGPAEGAVLARDTVQVMEQEVARAFCQRERFLDLEQLERSHQS